MAEPAPREPSLTCSVVPATSLNRSERDELFALMSSHFDRVSESQFFRDLDEKRAVPEARVGQFTGRRGGTARLW